MANKEFDNVSIDFRDLAGIQERTFFKCANGYSPGVLTPVVIGDDPSFHMNLVQGDSLLLTQFCYGVDTAAHGCLFEFGYCNADGTFFPVTPRMSHYAGATRQGFEHQMCAWTPPVKIAYGTGIVRITARIQVDDVNAEITIAYAGIRLKV